jgi:hypothetical protein
MGKQLFIPRTVQGADTNMTSSDLAAGEIAVVYPTSDGLTSIAVNSITDVDMPFQVVWRKYSTSDAIVSSPVLTLRELNNVTLLTSDAGNVQEVDITVAVPTTTAAGDTYSLKIIDTTPGTANLTKKTFEYVATGTYTAPNIVAHFASDISTDLDLKVVAASDATDTIGIKGTTTKNHFRVAVENNAGVTWTIAYTSDVRPGNVSQAYLTDLETKMKSHGEGITNTIWFAKPYTTEVYSSVARLGIFDFKLKNNAKHGMNAVDYENYTLYIATSDTGICSDINKVWKYGADSTSDAIS